MGLEAFQLDRVHRNDQAADYRQKLQKLSDSYDINRTAVVQSNGLDIGSRITSTSPKTHRASKGRV